MIEQISGEMNTAQIMASLEFKFSRNMANECDAKPFLKYFYMYYFLINIVVTLT